MASSTTYKQDVPPEGGYRKLDFSRVPAKKIWNWWAIIPAYCTATALGIYLWKKTVREIAAKELENSTAIIAMMPIIVAEKDRVLLKNLRRMRDEETELMKDVEGWETGTLFGEKVFKTQPADEFVLPVMNEFYGHAPEKAVKDKFWFIHKF